MTNAEIQVGEYVRTKNKGIKRIDRIEENRTVNKYLYFIGYDHNDREYGIIKTTEILKHSFNVIDLIEVGDYVNGYKVLNVGNDYVDIDCDKPSYDSYIFDNQFKTIVTHEQMKAMEYEVEEEDD